MHAQSSGGTGEPSENQGLDERRPSGESQSLILISGRDQLSRVEAFNTQMVYRTFSSTTVDRIMRLLTVHLGALWVDHCTRRLRNVHGLERLGPVSELKSFVLATNHRSYFDLFVTSMVLIKAGLRNRMIYPVRSNFFYDNPFGLLLNGIMSFFSMYPPIFRDKAKRSLNRPGLEEIAWFMTHRNMCVGIHPEGTRNKGDSPYELLSAKPGIGQLIHTCRVPVIPAFINGLNNNFKAQVISNFTGKGEQIHLVFGEPLDFSHYYEQSGRAPQVAIAKETNQAIYELGQEEKQIREAASES